MPLGSDGGSAHTPNAPEASLFPIFMLSMLTLVLVPSTLWRLCGGTPTEEKKQEYRKVSDTSSEWGRVAAKQAARLKPSLSKRISDLSTPGNVALAVGWLAVAGIILYIQSLSAEIAPFDPYQIMGVEHEATIADVKKAYRKLSLLYHPDKNPDPKATDYFASTITKAYEALTDETARENYAKYGHPDGQQSMSVGIALPAFLFDTGQMSPFVLAATVGLGILLPLAVAVWYLINSGKYTQNNIMTTTLLNYNYVMKPMMTLTRIPDVLVYAGEYLTRPVPDSHKAAVFQLSTALKKHHPEVDYKGEFAKKFFEKRPPAVVRAHLLLLAQTSRLGDDVPEALRSEFDFVVRTAPKLLDELIKVAIRGARPPYSYGYFRPTVAVLEMCQSITQAVPLPERKASEKSSASGDAGIASLLQLPHVDTAVTKKLTRKKVRGLADLMRLSVEERAAALETGGLKVGAIGDLETTLGTVPVLAMNASCETEGEEGGIMEGDVVTANVHVRLSRFSAQEAGKGVGSPPSFAPFYPYPRGESWWVLVADAAQNQCFVAQKVTLEEMEYVAPPPNPTASKESAAGKKGSVIKATASSNHSDGTKAKEEQVADSTSGVVGSAVVETEADEQGEQLEKMQLLQLRFNAPPPGVYMVTVLLMSDFWIGCEKRVILKLKVGKRTRADREGRAANAPGSAAAGALSDAGSDSDLDDEYDDDGGEVEDYDSEDGYATEESDDEAPVGNKKTK